METNESTKAGERTHDLKYNLERSEKWGVPCWDVKFSDVQRVRFLDGVHNARDLSTDQIWNEINRKAAGEAQDDLNENNQAGERTQHTPGPWKVVERRTISGHVTAPRINMESPPVGGGFIATLGFPPIGNRYANARLIAAAPELLEVARVALSYFANKYAQWDITAELRVAIAKAEGRAQ